MIKVRITKIAIPNFDLSNHLIKIYKINIMPGGLVYVPQ